METPRPNHNAVEFNKPEDYETAFSAFLEMTNEKQIVAPELRAALQEGTLLDIGSGAGDLLDLLERDPEQCTAIEPFSELAAQLQDKGYDAIQSTFPCPCDTYDNVLLSHVLYGKEQYGIVLDGAWDALNPGGKLCAVTYRDNKNDFNQLLNTIDYTRPTNDERFLDIHNNLAQRGSTAVKEITSHLIANDVKNLAWGLSFMATNNSYGSVQKRQETQAALLECAEILETYRTTEYTYSFPIEHALFVTDKGPHV